MYIFIHLRDFICPSLTLSSQITLLTNIQSYLLAKLNTRFFYFFPSNHMPSYLLYIFDPPSHFFIRQTQSSWYFSSQVQEGVKGLLLWLISCGCSLFFCLVYLPQGTLVVSCSLILFDLHEYTYNLINNMLNLFVYQFALLAVLSTFKHLITSHEIIITTC